MGGELGDFTIDQLGGTLALVLGSVGGLCLILFKSRCEKISICWGLWTCDRKVPDEDKDDDPEDPNKKKKNKNTTPQLVPQPPLSLADQSATPRNVEP